VCPLGRFIFRADTENTEVAQRNQFVTTLRGKAVPAKISLPSLIFGVSSQCRSSVNNLLTPLLFAPKIQPPDAGDSQMSHLIVGALPYSHRNAFGF